MAYRNIFTYPPGQKICVSILPPIFIGENSPTKYLHISIVAQEMCFDIFSYAHISGRYVSIFSPAILREIGRYFRDFRLYSETQRPISLFSHIYRAAGNEFIFCAYIYSNQRPIEISLHIRRAQKYVFQYRRLFL